MVDAANAYHELYDKSFLRWKIPDSPPPDLDLTPAPIGRPPTPERPPADAVRAPVSSAKPSTSSSRWTAASEKAGTQTAT